VHGEALYHASSLVGQGAPTPGSQGVVAIVHAMRDSTPAVGPPPRLVHTVARSGKRRGFPRAVPAAGGSSLPHRAGCSGSRLVAACRAHGCRRSLSDGTGHERQTRPLPSECPRPRRRTSLMTWRSSTMHSGTPMMICTDACDTCANNPISAVDVVVHESRAFDMYLAEQSINTTITRCSDDVDDRGD
jgi:hypothetical protein